LEPEKVTGGKDLTIHPERLSDGTYHDQESEANRRMRQSELAGRINCERKGRSTLPARSRGSGQKVTGTAVVRSYKEPLIFSGMVERSILKTGNNGETLDQESRQSRGVNQMNYARETYNRGLSESVIKSVLAGDRKRPAEMTGPFPPGKSNNKVYDSDDVLAAGFRGPSWSNP
jgi:hypothetical protein